MINIMGGDKNSEGFLLYKEQTIKGGLIAKKYFDALFEPIVLSSHSGLLCFLKNSLENFENRFLKKYNDFKTA